MVVVVNIMNNELVFNDWVFFFYGYKNLLYLFGIFFMGGGWGEILFFSILFLKF